MKLKLTLKVATIALGSMILELEHIIPAQNNPESIVSEFQTWTASIVPV
jgi:hypothetical protein